MTDTIINKGKGFGWFDKFIFTTAIVVFFLVGLLLMWLADNYFFLKVWFSCKCIGWAYDWIKELFTKHSTDNGE